MSETITILVKRDGAVTISVDGVEGQDCLESTRALEEALGMKSEDRDLKTEFFETEMVKEDA